MLKIKCQNCQEEISSPLLAEIDQIDCPHCQQNTPVKDVIIHTQGYSYHRNDLINRLFRYKTLLAEVAKERELLEKSPEASPESKKSLARFMKTLEEMLAGARNNLRMEFDRSLLVTYQVARFSDSAQLTNLSMKGACIETARDKALPRTKVPIKISLTLPGKQEQVSLDGVVAWTRTNRDNAQPQQIGISFSPLDTELRTVLWAFISHSAEH